MDILVVVFALLVIGYTTWERVMLSLGKKVPEVVLYRAIAIVVAVVLMLRLQNRTLAHVVFLFLVGYGVSIYGVEKLLIRFKKKGELRSWVVGIVFSVVIATTVASMTYQQLYMEKIKVSTEWMTATLSMDLMDGTTTAFAVSDKEELARLSDALGKVEAHQVLPLISKHWNKSEEVDVIRISAFRAADQKQEDYILSGDGTILVNNAFYSDRLFEVRGNLFEELKTFVTEQAGQ